MLFIIKNILCMMFFVQFAAGQWIKDTNYTHSLDQIQFVGNRLIAVDEQSFSSYQLLNGTDQWQTISAGPQGSFTYEIELLDTLQWIATETGFFYSSNSTSAWNLYGETTKFQSPPFVPTSLAVLPPKVAGQPYRLFSGTLGIGFYASTDGGHAWYEIDSARFHNHDVFDLRMTKINNDSVEFYMTNNEGIFVSNDFGDSWVESDSANVPVFTPNHLLHMTNDWFAIAQQGIFKRDHNTGIWMLSSDIFSDGTVFGSTTSGNSIFVAMRNKGIYRSTDAGSTWALADSFSIANFDITGLTNDGTNLFVATGVEGLWHMTISALGVTSVPNDGRDLPSKITIAQNYPNPFNPSTEISYTLTKTSKVSLKVFDLLGREIATLVDGKNEPGQHSVSWNAINVPSGVYFYRMVAGDFVQTKKMILMK